MHVLLTNFHPADGGGHTTYLASLAHGLHGRHRITLASPAGSRLNRVAREIGIEVADFDFPGGMRPAAIWRSARKLKKLFERESVDLVHVNGSRDHWIVVWASLLVKGRRPAIVWTKHNSFRVKRDPPNWFRARFFTDHTIAVSQSVARQVEESAYAAHGITTIRHGIDIGRFSPLVALDSRAALRALWAAGAGDLVIGSVAGTAGYKSWTTMAEALAMLSDAERQRLRVVVAGEPIGEVQKATVAALSVGDRMVFPGLAADVRPMIAAFDVGFVLSRSIETASYASLEMMAMGKPLLVSDFGSLPENVHDGRDGWIVPAGNPQAVATWLKKLLVGAYDLPQMGGMARRHAEAEFSLERFLDATEGVYRRAMQARDTAARR